MGVVINFKTRGSAAPVSPEEVEKINQLYATGMTMKEIADKIHRSPAAVGRAVGKYNYDRRPKTPSGYFDLDEYVKSDWTLRGRDWAGGAHSK